jgi:hypothetical protein
MLPQCLVECSSLLPRTSYPEHLYPGHSPISAPSARVTDWSNQMATSVTSSLPSAPHQPHPDPQVSMMASTSTPLGNALIGTPRIIIRVRLFILLRPLMTTNTNNTLPPWSPHPRRNPSPLRLAPFLRTNTPPCITHRPASLDGNTVGSGLSKSICQSCPSQSGCTSAPLGASTHQC